LLLWPSPGGGGCIGTTASGAVGPSRTWQLVGAHVKVHCQTAGQEFVDAGAEFGYVRWGADGVPEHQTLIKREQCAALRSYLRSSKHTPTESQVVAVHILTHESMHMRGASNTDAAALARRYWLALYPRMSEDYRSPDCRAGGALDERLPDAPGER
jgi:hypothetical protein